VTPREQPLLPFFVRRFNLNNISGRRHSEFRQCNGPVQPVQPSLQRRDSGFFSISVGTEANSPVERGILQRKVYHFVPLC